MSATLVVAIVSLVVAGAGLAVAIAGFLVNRRAILSEQTDRKQEIDDAWAREWAAQRPVVYPLALPEWAYRSAGSRLMAPRRVSVWVPPIPNMVSMPHSSRAEATASATVGVEPAESEDVIPSAARPS